MSLTRTELVNWLSKMDIKGNTLDVGGRVWSMKGKVRSFEGEYKAIDESDGDLNFIWFNADGMFDYYDNVFCTEVMQFVYDPKTVLTNLNMFVKTSGHVYLSFHLTHPPMKGHDYLRYTKKGVRKLLELTELEIEEFLEPIEGYYLVKCKRL